jgi:hypothetical protein
MINIPEGYLFIALTMRDPALPMAIMHWPTIRRDVDQKDYLYLATPENIEKRIKEEGHDVLSWRFIQYDDLPQDRTYRDALKDDGASIGHDMAKARKIHIDHARIDRIPKMEKLDRDWQRANGQGKATEAKTIETERQRLRDLPAALLPEVEAARTIAELEKITY